MTIKQLKGLRVIPLYIKHLKKELEALQTTPPPECLNIPQRREYVAQARELCRMYTARIERLQGQLDGLHTFVESIPDGIEKDIIMWRYAQGMSWYQVSRRCGKYGLYSEDSAKKVIYRYMARFSDGEENGTATKI